MKLFLFAIIFSIVLFSSSVLARNNDDDDDDNHGHNNHTPVHAHFSDTTNQTIPLTDTPQIITFNTNDTFSGIYSYNGDVTVRHRGKYLVILRAQVTKGNAVVQADDYLDLWLRIDGVDVPNSNVRHTIHEDYTTLTVQTIVDIRRHKKLNAMLSVVKTPVSSTDNTNGVKLTSNPSYITTGPVIPSASLTLVKLLY